MPDRCELPLTICKQIACMVETDSVDRSPAKERARVTANATKPWSCFMFSEESTRPHHRHAFPQHVPQEHPVSIEDALLRWFPTAASKLTLALGMVALAAFIVPG